MYREGSWKTELNISESFRKMLEEAQLGHKPEASDNWEILLVELLNEWETFRQQRLDEDTEVSIHITSAELAKWSRRQFGGNYNKKREAGLILSREGWERKSASIPWANKGDAWCIRRRDGLPKLWPKWNEDLVAWDYRWHEDKQS
jgi:hypothetical protein